MKSNAKDWLEAAKQDLILVETIINDDYLTGVACFHAQQCVEKSFKAISEECEGKIIKTHDLDKLFNIAHGYLKTEIDENLMDKLNSLYIESRYPGAFGFLPNGKPSLQDVGEFYKFAKHIFDSVKQYLEKQ